MDYQSISLTTLLSLLALFGDQFARQFASESLTWIDHVILAMVPLGILTIITGAIRVQGPRIAKSFIGRARENRALVELELMSSTSHEVCELSNGNSIIRVIGKPEIAQFFIFPSEYNTLEAKYRDVDLSNRATQDSKSAIGDKSCGIHTLQSAVWPESGTREQRLMHVRGSYSIHRPYAQSKTNCNIRVPKLKRSTHAKMGTTSHFMLEKIAFQRRYRMH